MEGVAQQDDAAAMEAVKAAAAALAAANRAASDAGSSASGAAGPAGGAGVHSLWVLKRSEVLRRWNRRFITLDEAAGVIEIREDDNDKKPRGVIGLRELRAGIVSPLNFHGKEQYDGCCLYLEVGANRKGVYLVADSPAASQQWVAAVQAALKRAKRRASSSGAARPVFDAPILSPERPSTPVSPIITADGAQDAAPGSTPPPPPPLAASTPPTATPPTAASSPQYATPVASPARHLSLRGTPGDEGSPASAGARRRRGTVASVPTTPRGITESDHESLMSASAMMQEVIRAQGETLAVEKARTEAAEARASSATDEARAAREEAAQLRGALEEARTNEARTVDKKAAVEAHVDELSSRLDEEAAHSSELEDRLRKMDDVVQRLERDLRESHDRVESTQAALLAEGAVLAEVRAKGAQERADAARERATLERAVQAAEARAETALKEQHDIAATLAELRREHAAEMDSTCRSYEQQVESARKDAADRLEAAKSDADIVAEERDAALEQVAELREALAKATKRPKRRGCMACTSQSEPPPSVQEPLLPVDPDQVIEELDSHGGRCGVQ